MISLAAAPSTAMAHTAPSRPKPAMPPNFKAANGV